MSETSKTNFNIFVNNVYSFASKRKIIYFFIASVVSFVVITLSKMMKSVALANEKEEEMTNKDICRVLRFFTPQQLKNASFEKLNRDFVEATYSQHDLISKTESDTDYQKSVIKLFNQKVRKLNKKEPRIFNSYYNNRTITVNFVFNSETKEFKDSSHISQNEEEESGINLKTLLRKCKTEGFSAASRLLGPKNSDNPKNDAVVDTDSPRAYVLPIHNCAFLNTELTKNAKLKMFCIEFKIKIPNLK